MSITGLTDVPREIPKCADCGALYQTLPMDVVLPNAQWAEITSYTEEILCVACILIRGSKLRKYVVAKLRFE